MKTREQVEFLKDNWKRDPCWDIEDTDGFEEYHDELLAFRKKQEAVWQRQKEAEHEKLASMLCPMSFGNSSEDENYHCVVEKCAWWCVKEKQCVVMYLACLARTGYSMTP